MTETATQPPSNGNGSHTLDEAMKLAERTAREVMADGEIGASGTKFFSGFIDGPEYNPKLEGQTGAETYRKMLADPQVKAAESVVVLPIRSAAWRISCDDAKIEEELQEQFFSRLDFERVLRHGMMAFSYGFELMEKVLVEDRGKWWYSRLAHRGQETVERWFPDKDDSEKLGGVQQLVWKDGGFIRPTIPGDKLFHLAWDAEGNNFAGQSGIKAAYRPWFIKDTLERINAIAYERMGLGVPGWEMPEQYSDADKAAAKETAKSFQAGEKAYVLAPHGWKFQVYGHSNQNRYDPLPYIRYCDEMIATSVLAMVLVLGRTETGSRALGESMLDLFMVALQAVADWFAAQATEQLVKPWLRWNYPDGDRIEAGFEWSNLQLQNIGFVSEAMQRLGQLGFVTPDGETEDTLREWMKLPAKPEASRVQMSYRRRARAGRESSTPTDAPHRHHRHRVRAAEPTFWRPLRPEERHVALREIDARQDDARDQIANAFADVQDDWIGAIVDQLRTSTADGDYSDVADIQVPRTLRNEPKREIMATLRETFRFGRRTVQEEAARQKRLGLRDDPPDPGERTNLFSTRAGRYLKNLASRLESLAAERTMGLLRTKGDDLEETDFIDIATALSGSLEKTAVNEATVMVSEAVNLGRDAAIQERKDDVATVIYSAILDDGTCEECLDADGAEVEAGSPEYYELMPPNKACLSVQSGSNRCRCIYVAVFEEE